MCSSTRAQTNWLRLVSLSLNHVLVPLYTFQVTVAVSRREMRGVDFPFATQIESIIMIREPSSELPARVNRVRSCFQVGRLRGVRYRGFALSGVGISARVASSFLSSSFPTPSVSFSPQS